MFTTKLGSPFSLGFLETLLSQAAGGTSAQRAPRTQSYLSPEHLCCPWSCRDAGIGHGLYLEGLDQQRWRHPHLQSFCLMCGTFSLVDSRVLPLFPSRGPAGLSLVPSCLPWSWPCIHCSWCSCFPSEAFKNFILSISCIVIMFASCQLVITARGGDNVPVLSPAPWWAITKPV